jgi:hypothetical protein
MSMILEYGKPGTGKTTMAMTMCKLGYIVLLYDADNKAHEMKNIQELINNNQIKLMQLDEPLIGSTLRLKATDAKTALLKQPKGYLKFCDMLDALLARKQKGEAPPADVLVIDSLTVIISHLKRLLMSIDPPSNKTAKANKLDFDHWSALQSNLEEVFVTLRSLTHWFKHIIVICHEQSDYQGSGDNLELTGIWPKIQGSMRENAGGYFDEVYNLRVKQIGKIPVYEALTQPVNYFTARTSRDLPQIIPCDYSEIYKDEIKETSDGTK